MGLLKKSCIILALLGICSIGKAQFRGGFEDGSTFGNAIGIQLDGSINSFSILYQGSNGDGFDSVQRTLLLSKPNFNIYEGGLNDGFSAITVSQTLSGDDVMALYTGNTGDGHSRELLQTLLDGDNLEILFSGRIGDGSNSNTLNSVLLEGFIAAIFNGGSGDGFASTLKPDNFLSGMMLMLYGGGVGDGFAKNILTTSLTLDIIDYLVENDIILYPNPASQTVNLKFKKQITISELALYDISGKRMNLKLSSDNSFDVSNLSDGVYLLTIFSEEGKEATKRLIVKK